MSQYCKYCGNKLEDGAQFCANCGNRVEDSYDGNIESNYSSTNNNNNYNYGSNNTMDENKNPFETYFIDVFRKRYALFEGRASRKEYWMFVLFQFLVSIGIFIIEDIIDLDGFLTIIYAFATLVPGLGLVIRRLHDVGKSGWWYFVCFIPFIGSIWILILLCTQSQYGENQYGQPPVR